MKLFYMLKDALTSINTITRRKNLQEKGMLP